MGKTLRLKATVERHIKRPMNAFMCWSSYERKMNETGVMNEHMSLGRRCTVLGQLWNMQTPTFKSYWYAFSDALHKQHMIDFPGYKYCPTKPLNKLDEKVNMKPEMKPEMKLKMKPKMKQPSLVKKSKTIKCYDNVNIPLKTGTENSCIISNDDISEKDILQMTKTDTFWLLHNNDHVTINIGESSYWELFDSLN